MIGWWQRLPSVGKLHLWHLKRGSFGSLEDDISFEQRADFQVLCWFFPGPGSCFVTTGTSPEAF